MGAIRSPRVFLPRESRPRTVAIAIAPESALKLSAK